MNKDIKKPNFFIIGAPKCGTTSLSEYLRDHPDIFFSDPKEPDYFDTDFSNQVRLFTNKKEYLENCFNDNQNYKKIGEGSVKYLYSQKAVSNILEFNSEAKFIVMTRDPVEMFYSLHVQLLTQADEVVRDPEMAWRLQSAREQGEYIPSSCSEPKMLQYGEVCKLGKQIKRLYNTVPSKKRVKIIRFENFTNNTKQVYEEVLDFLNLESDEREDFPVYNANEEIRFLSIGALKKTFLRPIYNNFRPVFEKLKELTGTDDWNIFRWNYKKTQRESLDEDFKKELEDYFEQDQELLEHILENS